MVMQGRSGSTRLGTTASVENPLGTREIRLNQQQGDYVERPPVSSSVFESRGIAGGFSFCNKFVTNIYVTFLWTLRIIVINKIILAPCFVICVKLSPALWLVPEIFLSRSPRK